MSIKLFMAKFSYLMRIEQTITGKHPHVCILGPDEYACLKQLASDECTVPCEDIARSSPAEIEYMGVACFYSGSFNGIMFGVLGDRFTPIPAHLYVDENENQTTQNPTHQTTEEV
jgi:hypothetical protein